MSKFVELTTGGKPILVNADHVISVTISGFSDEQTELRINQYQYLERKPSSAAPVFEIIIPNCLTIDVDQDYATVIGLLLAKPQTQSR